MFSFFSSKRTLLESGVMRGLVDHHSHILPGVDDGVKSLSSSLEVLKWYEELGVKRVHLTPHIMSDLPNNRPAFLSERFEMLKSKYSGGVELCLGGEYMLDSAFDRQLSSGELLPLVDDHLLVETSYMSSPIDFQGRLDSVMSNGYFVVLAHPERYMSMRTKDYERLKRFNVRFQLNLLSLVGGYGSESQKRAERLLEEDMYDMIGTDLHALESYKKYLSTVKVSKDIIEMLEELKERSEEL